MKDVYRFFYWLFFLFFFSAAALAEITVTPSISVKMEKTGATIISNGILLKDLVDRIKKDMGVEIRGITCPPNKLITFRGNGPSSEIVLRQLLRHLGEKSFAYEFSNDKLVRINVFPKGTQAAIEIASAHASEPLLPIKDEPPGAADLVSLVEIVSVLEETQAKTLGLQKGDYIYMYNGKRVLNAEELVAETSEDGDPTPADMVIIRNDTVNHHFLDKGFIGVQVKTAKIPKEALPDGIATW